MAKGLRRWAELCQRRQAAPSTAPATNLGKLSETLARDTLDAIRKTWPGDPADWWLSPQVEPLERPKRLTGSFNVASYTNYRYWPELLSSGLLPRDMANRVVEGRLTAGGQFCGMTRFAGHLDDWPLTDYLYGLWCCGRKNEFLLSLYGHVAYHQAEGHSDGLRTGVLSSRQERSGLLSSLSAGWRPGRPDFFSDSWGARAGTRGQLRTQGFCRQGRWKCAPQLSALAALGFGSGRSRTAEQLASLGSTFPARSMW